jgi:hypothetical protein
VLGTTINKKQTVKKPIALNITCIFEDAKFLNKSGATLAAKIVTKQNCTHATAKTIYGLPDAESTTNT